MASELYGVALSALGIAYAAVCIPTAAFILWRRALQPVRHHHSFAKWSCSLPFRSTLSVSSNQCGFVLFLRPLARCLRFARISHGSWPRRRSSCRPLPSTCASECRSEVCVGDPCYIAVVVSTFFLVAYFMLYLSSLSCLLQLVRVPCLALLLKLLMPLASLSYRKYISCARFV